MTSNDLVKYNRGMLIVFEGIDGTGKSTQLELLERFLTDQGHEVVRTKEPTEGKYGRKIRNLYVDREQVSRQEELELFILDRKEHVESLLQPNLAAGRIVLSDRYYLSTIAYQGAAGLDPLVIEQKNSFAPRPDIAFLLQLPPEVSVKRIVHGRGESLNDFEQEEYLNKVQRIFDTMDYPFIHRIDSNRSIDLVHHDVLSIVIEHLNNQR